MRRNHSCANNIEAFRNYNNSSKLDLDYYMGINANDLTNNRLDEYYDIDH